MPINEQDKKIIKKIIEKDERTIALIYNQYKKSIFNFVNKQLNNTLAAEELTQDIFFDFIENLRDFRGDSSLKTFLFSIARYKVIDVIRKKKIKRIFFCHLPNSLIENISAFILDDEIEKKELKEKIKKAFDKLPNDYQVILRLKYVNGERVRKISEKLTLTFKATESLLFRARRAFTKVFNALP